MSDLKQATKKALLWSFFDKIGQQAINLVVVIFTARLLLPSEFGIIASLTIFTAFSTMLLEGGLSVTLIRKIDSTDRDYDTVFFLNLVVGVFIFCVLFFAAPLIGRFYREPQMVVISRVVFFNFIINALGIIQSTLLVKRMDFKSLTLANITSIVSGGIVSVWMAFSGYGVWALVAQAGVSAAVKTIMLWKLSGWIPRFKIYKKEFKDMYSFSYKLMIGNIINTISTNFYSFILGRYFPMSQVGLYSQANKMKEMASSMLWGSFGSSTYSMLSNLQNEPERLKNAMRKSIRTLAFVAFPAMGGLAVVAAPVIHIFIGSEKWGGCVPLMQLLCVGALFFILTYINGNFIKLGGRAGAIIKLESLNAFLLIVFLFLTIGYGIKVAIISDVLSKAIVYCCYMIVNARTTGYKVLEQIRDILPAAAITLVMCVSTYLLKYVITSNVLLLISQLTLGAVIYGGINKMFDSAILEEILQTFRKKR